MIRPSIVALALASVVLIAGRPAAAQPRSDGGIGIGGGRPMFLEHLYRPELIMRNQAALALTAEQRAAIVAAIKEAQSRLSGLQWDLDAKAEAVAKLVEVPKIDVDATLASATQVIELEGQIKKEHLRLLLTIKNLLTPAQQAKLREIKADRWGPPGGRGPGPGGPGGGPGSKRPGAPPPPQDDGGGGAPPPPPGDDGGPPP